MCLQYTNFECVLYKTIHESFWWNIYEENELSWGLVLFEHTRQHIRLTYSRWSAYRAPMAHACNPNYSGGRDEDDHGSKAAQENSLWDPF
jgi:hypothetical protein